jgi:hypothetical protein
LATPASAGTSQPSEVFPNQLLSVANHTGGTVSLATHRNEWETFAILNDEARRATYVTYGITATVT